MLRASLHRRWCPVILLFSRVRSGRSLFRFCLRCRATLRIFCCGIGLSILVSRANGGHASAQMEASEKSSGNPTASSRSWSCRGFMSALSQCLHGRKCSTMRECAAQMVKHEARHGRDSALRDLSTSGGGIAIRNSSSSSALSRVPTSAFTPIPSLSPCGVAAWQPGHLLPAEKILRDQCADQGQDVHGRK